MMQLQQLSISDFNQLACITPRPMTFLVMSHDVSGYVPHVPALCDCHWLHYCNFCIGVTLIQMWGKKLFQAHFIEFQRLTLKIL